MEFEHLKDPIHKAVEKLDRIAEKVDYLLFRLLIRLKRVKDLEIFHKHNHILYIQLQLTQEKDDYYFL